MEAFSQVVNFRVDKIFLFHLCHSYTKRGVLCRQRLLCFGVILPKIDDSIDFSEGDTYVEEKVKHITINCKAPKIWDNTETIDKQDRCTNKIRQLHIIESRGCPFENNRLSTIKAKAGSNRVRMIIIKMKRCVSSSIKLPNDLPR